MTHIASPWLAGALGAAILATVPAAQAGGFFRHCHPGCAEQVVSVPQQDIRIEVPRPKVIVQGESKHRVTQRSAAVIAPVVASVYAPMPLPVAPVMPFAAPPPPEPVFDPHAAIREAHRLELQALEYDRILKTIQADQAAAAAVQQRAMQLLKETPTPACPPRADEGARKELETEIKKLSSTITALTERVQNMERMLLFHDDVIRKMIQFDQQKKKE